MAKIWKPTVDETLDLYADCKAKYDASGIFSQWDEDELFYELDFKSRLLLPTKFEVEGIVLPTARDLIDSWVDNIDVFNPRVLVGRKGESPKSEEEKNLLRKFGLGVLYANNVESSIAPLQVSRKHFGIYGLTILQTVWDADRWLDKPEREDGESDEAYAERIDSWRAEHHTSIPIVIKAIHPRNIMLDPYYDGGKFVFETREELCFDVHEKYPKWSNPKGVKASGKVEHISFWTKDYRCELYDREPVLRTPVMKHNYGFIPYTAIDTGLGNVSADNDLKKRYVGILRYVRGILISESRDYSIGDIILKKQAWPWGYATGANAQGVTGIETHFGDYTPLPDGVELHDMIPKVPPEALLAWMSVASGYLAGHAAPPSVRGMGEEGVRSGAHYRAIISQAATRYIYSNEAYKHGVAKILSNCARIMKNVVPGDINVWAKTPTDEFDIEIKKDKMKEPFSFYVEFAPISEEDEYRRHDDLLRLAHPQLGLVSKNWARKQMSNVDAKAMELEEEVERLKQDPAVQQVISQYMTGKLMEALAKRGAAEMPTQVPIPEAPSPMGTPQRRMVPPIPERAPLGSAEEIQAQLKKLRSQTPLTQQGQGGGGQR